MKSSEKIDELWKSGVYGTGTLPPTLQLIKIVLYEMDAKPIPRPLPEAPRIIQTKVVPPRHG